MTAARAANEGFSRPELLRSSIRQARINAEVVDGQAFENCRSAVSAKRVLAVAELLPGLQQGASFVEEVGPRVGSLDSVTDQMGEAGFNDLAWEGSLLASPGGKMQSESRAPSHPPSHPEAA